MPNTPHQTIPTSTPCLPVCRRAFLTIFGWTVLVPTLRVQEVTPNDERKSPNSPDVSKMESQPIHLIYPKMESQGEGESEKHGLGFWDVIAPAEYQKKSISAESVESRYLYVCIYIHFPYIYMYVYIDTHICINRCLYKSKEAKASSDVQRQERTVQRWAVRYPPP